MCFSSKNTVQIWGTQHVQAARSHNPPVHILVVLQTGKKQQPGNQGEFAGATKATRSSPALGWDEAETN